MKPCPNCQQPIPEHASVCPNCGLVLSSVIQNKVMTGIPWLDILLGIIASLASPFLFGVGIIAAIVLCCVLWRTYTSFARGLLIGLIVWGALLLGALAVCIGILVTASR